MLLSRFKCYYKTPLKTLESLHNNGGYCYDEERGWIIANDHEVLKYYYGVFRNTLGGGWAIVILDVKTLLRIKKKIQTDQFSEARWFF